MKGTIHEEFETAREIYRSGDTGIGGEEQCRRILETEPDHADTLHLLGLLSFGKGDYESALTLMERAATIDPGQHLHWYKPRRNEADLRAHRRSAALLREVSRPPSPPSPQGLHSLGAVFQELGLLDRAGDCYRQTLSADGNNEAAILSLGHLSLQTGRHNEATAWFERALSHNPDSMEACRALGDICIESGRFEEEILRLRSTFAANPGGWKILCNLGDALTEEDRYEEALVSLEHAATLNPLSADLQNAVGLARKRLGRYEEASESFKKALDLDPACVEARNNLGVACYGLGLFDEAKGHFEAAIGVNDAYATAHANLVMILAEEGFWEAARESYERAYNLEPNPGLKIALATLLPVIYRSRQEMEFTAAALGGKLDAVERSGLSIDDPIRQIGRANFYLAYLGKDVSILQARLARFYKSICPAVEFVAPHCRFPIKLADERRIKIGFISRHLKDHTIGKYMRSIIRHLDRRRFEVLTFLFPNRKDATTEFLELHSERVVPVPESLPAIRKIVAAEELDILFYPDIGMEPYTYFLAMSRLAPVQCAFYGHPVTTGIPTVDYFISHEDCETEGADRRYTEKLVRLSKSVTYTCYDRPERKGPPRTKEDYGLPGSAHLYLCCQSLFKVHPDFDAVLKDVLSRDKDGLIYFFHGKHEAWATLLKERLHETLGDDIKKVEFLPRCAYDDYLTIVALADVVLDTPFFNGGATTFDALGVAVPVVTMPGEFMRGRQTYSLYRRMGIMECVAADGREYADIAVRLGTDPLWREHVAAQIRDRSHLIFQDAAMVRDLEARLIRMVEGTPP